MLTGDEQAATQSRADHPTHFQATTRARDAGRLARTP